MTSAPGERDDATLVAAALAGEDRAFTELMRRHKGAVFRVIRRYVGNSDEAYDLLQETFVSAWSALSKFDKRRPISSWLQRVALNKCRDWTRRRQVRRFFYSADSLDSPAAKAIVADAVGADDKEHILARLDAAIAALPPRLKEPLILVTIAGMSQIAAAQTLGVSPKAIETRLYRARHILNRTLLDEDGPA